MQYQLSAFATVAALFFYFILRRIIRKVAEKHAQRKKLAEHRVNYVLKLYNISSFVLLLFAIAVIWGISLSGISLFAASFFTIAGIGFFASWFILSNITAAVILFIHSPFKIGSEIRIMDGDNSMEGKVDDITLFSIVISLANKDKIHCPNNLVIQKPIITKKYE